VLGFTVATYDRGIIFADASVLVSFSLTSSHHAYTHHNPYPGPRFSGIARTCADPISIHSLILHPVPYAVYTFTDILPLLVCSQAFFSLVLMGMHMHMYCAHIYVCGVVYFVFFG